MANNDVMTAKPRMLAFGPFAFDTARDVLYRDGAPVSLGSRAACLLSALLDRAPDLVSKRELMEAAWSDQAVEEGNLTVQLSALRRALGGETWIATVPGRGYRFQGHVRVAGDPRAVPAMSVDASSAQATWREDAPRVAVLPFANLSVEPRWSYFCDGLVEDIITDLARQPDLLVLARQSSFAYRNTTMDVRAIGRALDAAYIVEGSVQAAGAKLKVTAQLIEAESGTHVWAERYAREETDLFAVQADIVDRIVAALSGFEGEILRSRAKAARRKAPASLAAYELYLLGQEQEKRLDREGIANALDLLERSIELDSNFARAWVVLSWAWGVASDNGFITDAETAERRWKAAALRAAELDPGDGLALTEYGEVLLRDGKHPEARAVLERAQHLGARHADTLALNAKYVSGFFGDPERALTLLDRAFRLNPHAPSWYHAAHMLSLYFAGRFEAALGVSARTPPLRFRTLCRLLCLVQLGCHAEAEAERAKLLDQDPELAAIESLEPLAAHPDARRLLADSLAKAGLSDETETATGGPR